MNLESGTFTHVEGEEYTYGEILDFIEDGEAAARKGWNGKNLVIVKQIPATIGEEIIPKMQSLPQRAKDLLMANTKEIHYANQMLIINLDTGVADSWVASSSDTFANDWFIV